MLEVSTNLVKDDETKNVLNHIFQEAQGKVLTLSAAPTATAPLLKDYEWGVYSNVLYQRVGSTILVFTPGSTVAIT
ncbi:MAG: hypothetical protein ABFC84_16670 [Veillonellales bacterium]